MENNKWNFINDIHNDQKSLKEMPKDVDFEILFDNGEIHRYSDDDFPFCEIIAWRHLDDDN